LRDTILRIPKGFFLKLSDKHIKRSNENGWIVMVNPPEPSPLRQPFRRCAAWPDADAEQHITAASSLGIETALWFALLEDALNCYRCCVAAREAAVGVTP
jgi:hypothetical protein